MGVALGWSVIYRDNDWFVLAVDKRRAIEGALRANARLKGKGTKAIKAAQAECDVARAWTYRVNYERGQACFICGWNEKDAIRKAAADMPALRESGFRAQRVDPYWLFHALPEEELRVIGRALWSGQPKDRGPTHLDRPLGRYARTMLAISLRLAMELDWWAEGGRSHARRVALDKAKQVHKGAVSLHDLEEAIEVGLRIPGGLTEPQRAVLRRIVPPYFGDGEDVTKLTDEQLLRLWREGPGYDFEAHERGERGY